VFLYAAKRVFSTNLEEVTAIFQTNKSGEYSIKKMEEGCVSFKHAWPKCNLLT